MGTYSSDQVREKPDEFSRSLRGYAQPEVRAFVGRLALLIETFHGGKPKVSELPQELLPSAIRVQEFPMHWRGFRRSEVQSFLEEIAQQIETEMNTHT